MATVYIGQIIYVGFNFAPAGWAMCNGSLLPISENEPLFNLIGTTYGGDGQTTFGLPDLRGRTPVHVGSGYALAQQGGQENVTLTSLTYPTHTHPLFASGINGNSNSPGGNVFASGQSIYTNNGPLAGDALNANAVTVAAGGNQPHSNLQPFLASNWIISLQGIYPTQS